MEIIIVGRNGRMVTYPYLGSDEDHSVPGRVYYGRPGRDGTEDEIAARIPRRRVRDVLREYGWRGIGRAQNGGWIWQHDGERFGVLRLPSGPHPLTDPLARQRVSRAVAAVEGCEPWAILDVMGIDY